MFIIGTLMAVACLTMLAGLAFHLKRKNGVLPSFAVKTLVGGFSGFFVIVVAVMVAVLFNAAPTFASEAASASSLPAEAFGMAFIGAGLSVGLACIGTGIATGMAASAAIGAVSENPKMLGTTLLFVGLSEGIAIYGFGIALMILGRLG